MKKQSAGLMMYRRGVDGVEVFLVHPGGPYYAAKDLGSWTMPKGLFEDGEDGLTAAKREFIEETGFVVGDDFLELGWVKQAGGKLVFGWAFAGDVEAETLVSNVCEIEWPPRSGQQMEIPEVDRGAWFGVEEARRRLVPSHGPLLDRLLALLGEA